MTRLASDKPKYGNSKEVVEGITFASKREAQRYKDLRLLEEAGEIEGLRCQVSIPLHAYDFLMNTGVKVADYVADFVYRNKGDDLGTTPIVEDAKGFRTQTYRLKKRWVKVEHGIDIHEV